MSDGAPPGDSGDLDRLLAEAHAARLLAARALEGEGRRPSHAELWAHARRDPGAPVPLALVRALREDTAAARRYRAMLGALALAHAPVAMAASDGAVRRRVGAAVLELLPGGDGDTPLLVLTGGPAAGAIEMIGADAAPLRLALPPPEGASVVLALGPDVAEGEEALRLLRDPATALFLLP